MSNETQRKTSAVHQIDCPVVNLEASASGMSQPEFSKSSADTSSEYESGWSLEQELAQFKPSKSITITEIRM